MGDLISSLSPTLMVIVPQNNFLNETQFFPMVSSLSWFISLTTIALTIAKTNIKTNHAQYQSESYQIEPHYILYNDELNNCNINFAPPHKNNFNIFLLFLPCPQRYFDLAI